MEKKDWIAPQISIFSIDSGVFTFIPTESTLYTT